MDQLLRYLFAIASAMFLSLLLGFVQGVMAGVVGFVLFVVAGLLTIVLSIKYAKDNIQVRGLKELKNLMIPAAFFILTVLLVTGVCLQDGCRQEFGGVAWLAFFAFWLFIFLSIYIAILTAQRKRL